MAAAMFVDAASASAASAAVTEVLYSLRIELTFMVAFGALWICNRLLQGKSKSAKGPAPRPRAMRPSCPGQAPFPDGGAASAPSSSSPAVPRRRPGAAAAAREHHSEIDISSPTPEQLRDPAWVAAAVQQVGRSQMQRALELYKEALAAGFDLEDMPAAEGAQLFMALVSSAIRMGQPDEALRLLKECRARGPGVTLALLSSATKLCTSKQFFKECLAIYDFVAQDRELVVDDKTVWSCLLFCAVEARAYGRCSFFFERLKAFGLPSHKDYGNMIRSAASPSHGDWRLALALIAEMREACVEVDSVVYNTALSTCVAAGQTDQALAVLEDMEVAEGVVDVITYNTLAKGFARAGRMDKCFALYDRMRARGIVPSQVTYGILLDCCVNEKEMEKAAEVFKIMTKEGCVMNTILYTTLIKGFARAGETDQAMKVFEQMRQAEEGRGVTPDLITFSILIKANCDCGRLAEALQLLESMMELRLAPDEVVFNNLLGGCVRKGDAALGARLYRNMCEGGLRPSNATFSIMIRLHATCKQLDEAVEMMQIEPAKRGVEPEPRLYVQLAQACLRERQGRRAVEVVALMLQRGAPTTSMQSSLLGMCTKLNMLDTGASLLALAAEAGCRVDPRDISDLHDAALRKKKSAVAESVTAAAAKLAGGK